MKHPPLPFNDLTNPNLRITTGDIYLRSYSLAGTGKIAKRMARKTSKNLEYKR